MKIDELKGILDRKDPAHHVTGRLLLLANRPCRTSKRDLNKQTIRKRKSQINRLQK